MPSGFPYSPAGCFTAANANDGIGLKVVLEAPTGATGFAFDWKWYAFEYDEWVCTSFVDGTAVTVGGQNVMLDPGGEPVNSSTSIEVCSATPGCPNSATDFSGTGFDVWDDSGATLWHTTNVSVVPGNSYAVVFSIWDGGDGAFDSTVLFDRFRWTYD